MGSAVVHINESHFDWVYPALVVVSLLFLVLFPTGNAGRPLAERKKYWAVQTVTLVSAILGAKLTMLWGDQVRVVGWQTVLFSGRSITGGLLFGFFGAELAKPLLGYRDPPNDWFAAKLPFSVALGRVGCTLAGCCRGRPGAPLLAVAYQDGVTRWPIQPLEVLFQLACGLWFVSLVRQGKLRGRIFNLYLAIYGVFRFFTEFLRVTPKPYAGLSAYQLLSVVMVVTGILVFGHRTQLAQGSAYE